MSERLDSVRRRMKRLKTLPVLPTLLTAGNLGCGMTAILCATHYPTNPNMLFIGAVLIFVAMICDMFDGKVARLTGTNGPFGAQLDSLSDVVSFGVAPAILVHRMIIGASAAPFDHGYRLLLFITVFYAVMAAIRLARYNVEHSGPDEPTTSHFRGLPSPGAAAVVCAWVILHEKEVVTLASLGLTNTVPFTDLASIDAFRWCTLGIFALSALLMVSTLPYGHIGSALFGRLSFRSLVILLMIGSLLVVWPVWTLFTATTGYLLWGIVAGAAQAWQNWRRGRAVLDDDDAEAEDAGLGATRDATTIDDTPAHGR